MGKKGKQDPPDKNNKALNSKANKGKKPQNRFTDKNKETSSEEEEEDPNQINSMSRPKVPKYRRGPRPNPDDLEACEA